MKKSLLILFGPLVFAMGSLNAQTTYLSEDFEGGSIPAGWTANPAAPAANAWAVPGVTSAYFTPPAHTIYADMNDDANQTAANPNQMLETPAINLTAATTVYLKYDSYYLGQSPETAFVKYSLDGGATWTNVGAVPALTSGWKTNAVNVSAMVGGQSNVMFAFVYNDGAAWSYGFAVDNVLVYTPPATDANFSLVTPSAGSPSSFGTVSSNISIGGTFQNTGLSAITSIAVKYNDGTSTYTDNISSINVAAFATYNFTHNIPYNIPSLGAHPIKVWLELSGDVDHTNDTLGTIINGALFIPVHNVTVEEGTGTWCGWCVRGMVYLDSMNAVHPTDCNLIAVHNSDPMVYAAYDTGMGGLIGGYPSTVINRNIVSDPMYIFDDYANTIGDFGYADITPTVSFNAATRVATVNVSAHFAVDLSGDYRLACVFTEDNVHSTAGGQWDQHNYYSSQSQNIALVDQETGMDFQALPQVIPSAQMYYNYVARTILGGFNGQTASLPATITAGSTQTYTFTYTVPAAYNAWNMHVKVLLIDNTQPTKHIMNSAGVSAPLGIESPDASALNGVQVYPNPFNQNMNVDINLMNNADVTVQLFDMTGKLVSSENEGQLAIGQHLISVDGSTLANGMYFVKVTAGSAVVTQKVSVAH